MYKREEPSAGEENKRTHHIRWLWPVIIAGALFVVLVGILMPRPGKTGAGSPTANAPASRGNDAKWSATLSAEANRASAIHRHDAQTQAAEQIVANKLSQFVSHRRKILEDMARHFKVEVPPQFEEFFNIAETDDWESLTNSFEALNKLRMSQSSTEAMSRLWPVITETYGVAETAHNWPAQQLLDYGQAILGSLGPNMVYVGGTDAGRFIPTLLNDTSEGARHVVLTQNALADQSYLGYMDFLYGDQLKTMSASDLQQAFSAYTQDAAKRLQHDQQFPNEPPQIRPGESIQMTDNRVQVSGRVAVMAINEGLLQTLMENNPNVSFAIEQSFAFKSMYPNTTTLGPIMELGAKDSSGTLTPERADASVNYWATMTPQLLSELAGSDSPPVRQEYAKMAAEQAALLLNRQYASQAEADFQYALQLDPGGPDAVLNYVNMLVSQGRKADAIPVVQNAIASAPENQSFQSLLQRLSH